VGISLLFLKLEAFSYKATTDGLQTHSRTSGLSDMPPHLRDMISVLALTAFAALSL
jgi:hypothetical protein